jgi:hypothetical protein
LSVPTAELTAPPLGAHDRATSTSGARGLSNERFYLWLGAVALAVAAISLLIPSTPSYDPWSWLVWGREILHLSLHTPGGPTWKPLPVIFTTVFSLFGSAQPDLWLIVARAGAFVAVVMTFKLAARFTWWLRGELSDQPAGLDRAASWAPPALAGLIAILGLTLSGNLLSDSALGYSEGLMTAATLIALERHVDGHRHQAFALGFVAALDRPEIWLFWGPYGLWLMWKDPSSRRLVAGLAVLTLVLWFVPQKIGGGSLTSGVARAQHPRSNSAAFASCPFCTELADDAWPLVLLRIKIAALLVLGAGLLVLGRAWRGRRSFGLHDARERAIFYLGLCAAFGFGWWILVAVETQAGFSGNQRYLVLGAAFIEIAGGAAFGWAAYELARLARRHLAAARDRLAPYMRTGISALACAAVFLIVPNWLGPNLNNVGRTHRSLLFQATLRKDMSALIQRNGGVKALLNCGAGHIMVEGFQVPMAAWYFKVRTIDIQDQPNVNAKQVAVPPKPWPNVIFQDRDTGNPAQPLLPLVATIQAWEREGAHYRFEITKEMYFFEDCAAQPNDPIQQHLL